MRRGLRHYCDTSFAGVEAFRWKVFPDEEGIETLRLSHQRCSCRVVGKYSPMRRGLRHQMLASSISNWWLLESIPR